MTQATITTTETASLDFRELSEVGSTLPADAFGCHVRVAKPLPGLLVFEHSRDGHVVYVPETTENRADAPASLNYVLTIDGQSFPIAGHKRLRRTWIGKTPTPATYPPLIQQNNLTWNDWYDVPPMSLGKIVPDGEATDTTGGAPEHGVYPAWSNDPMASLMLGRVHGHLPMALRDPVTLQPIRDTKVRIGFNPDKVLGVSIGTLGNKCDTAHCWGSLPFYLAAKGTVLERFAAECMEFVALHAILSDYPGQLWRKQVRGQGRSLRNVTDWLEVCECRDKFSYDNLAAAIEYYDNIVGLGDQLSIERGIRTSKTSKRRCVAGFEWAQLLFGLYRATTLCPPITSFIAEALDWFALVSPRGVPYEINLSDAGSTALWDEAKVIAEEKAAGDAIPTRYNEFRKEQFVMDWLRQQLRLPTLKPLDAPEYVALTANANTAGFALQPPRPQWLATAKRSTDAAAWQYGPTEVLADAKHNLSIRLGEMIGGYLGEGSLDVVAGISNGSNA